jgi:hypothetical protein
VSDETWADLLRIEGEYLIWDTIFNIQQVFKDTVSQFWRIIRTIIFKGRYAIVCISQRICISEIELSIVVVLLLTSDSNKEIIGLSSDIIVSEVPETV